MGPLDLKSAQALCRGTREPRLLGGKPVAIFA